MRRISLSVCVWLLLVLLIFSGCGKVVSNYGSDDPSEQKISNDMNESALESDNAIPPPPENTPDAAPVDSLDDKNNKPASFSASLISLKSDASEELYTRYDTGAVIGFDYSVHSAHDADEYRITCEGESITLLSPSQRSIDPSGSYKLEFRAPKNGAGKIVLTLTAITNGNASDEEAHAYLYWSSCDLGVFVSAAEIVPELVMAKAQYDANEITSRDYYNIVHSQHFQVDIELMNMLSRVSSDKAEFSGYAAPYVEAVHNSIFHIESKAEVPAISDTLKKIEDELGVDLNEEDTANSSLVG